MAQRKLAHEIHLGVIQALIWEHDERNQPRYEVSLLRLAKDDGSASSFFQVDDLPLVAEVVDLAHLWIFEQAELIA